MENLETIAPMATTGSPIVTFKKLFLPSAAIQNFYIMGSPTAGNEIYVTQRKAKDTYLSRCIIQSDKTAVCVDYAILVDYGHGESLEVNTYGGVTYIWLGYSAHDDYPKYYWARQVARVQYVKTNTAVGSTPAETTVTGRKSLNNMRRATSDGTPLEVGEIKRVAVAIADGSDRIGFRVQLKSDNIYYCIYDLSDVNAHLSNMSTTSTSMENMTAAWKATVPCNVLPNGSFQGFDMTGVGTGNKFLYLIGGGSGDTPKINKVLYTNGGNYTNEGTTTITNTTLEVEGIQILGNYLYFALDSGASDTTSIYRITTP